MHKLFDIKLFTCTKHLHSLIAQTVYYTESEEHKAQVSPLVERVSLFEMAVGVAPPSQGPVGGASAIRDCLTADLGSRQLTFHLQGH